MSAATSTVKRRVPLALYRQLLQWAKSNRRMAVGPLSSYVPPLFLQEPQVDLKDVDALLPSNVVRNRSSSLTCPIHSVDDVEQLTKALFRMNKKSDSSNSKEQIALGFDALKSLNALTPILEDSKRLREMNMERDDQEILYRVGDVVRHNSEQWRGVIIGWKKIEDDASESANSSLTSKSYPLVDNIQYSVLLDAGDAQLHYTKRREPGNMNVSMVHQSDLSPVTDGRLCRIRNSHASEHFSKFDTERNRFVPNESKAYEYPADIQHDDEDEDNDTDDVHSLDELRTSLANELRDGLRRTALRLRQMVTDEMTISSDAPPPSIVNAVLEQLDALTADDVDDPEAIVPMNVRLSSPKRPIPATIVAMAYLQRWNTLVLEIQELVNRRRRSLANHKDVKLQFQLGDVVQHKGYGFRGVVVGWDPKPVMDVSYWDGLQDLVQEGIDPNTLPFYHIVPDQRDCIEAFGGERPSRYVCEANLELCLPDRRKEAVIEAMAGWKRNSANGTFEVPMDIRYKYGYDMDDDGVTERVLTKLKSTISHLYVAARDDTPVATVKSDESLDVAAAELSMTNFLQMLQVVESMGDAIVVSETIKEMWKAHESEDLRQHLDDAIEQLMSGKTEQALVSFGSLLARDPLYAEAWNKASTCEYMMGQLESAKRSAEQALDVQPQHFQARNGLGLVLHDLEDLHGAVECFQKGMECDPWSPVSSRLAVAMEQLERIENETEADDDDPQPNPNGSSSER